MWGAPPAGADSEMEVLLRKFVERGVITQNVANEIKSEISREVKPAPQKIVLDDSQKKELAKDLLPKWIQNTVIKGDVRTRYQYEKKDSSSHERNRGRVRYRLGFESKIGDQFKAGGRLASGSSDPRSTNQTFESSFQTPDIRLDTAYGIWSPVSNVSAAFGKFERKGYLWAPADMLWDGDVNPEGVSLNLKGPVFDLAEGYLNTGLWVLDENGASADTDPFMKYVQAGVKLGEDNLTANLAAIYYMFEGVRDHALDHCAGTNTGVSSASSSCSGALLYDYDSVGISGEAGISNLLYDIPVQYAGIIGDAILNISDDVQKNKGWALGFKVGNKKVSKKHDWQAKYLYAKLEADAFPDVFPDSDRFGGKTDVKGHEVAFEYVMADNVILGLDYYRSERLDNSTDKEDLFQADVVLKF
jgi:hypothetical protein